MLVALAVAIATLVASSLASGAVGGLTYRGCITGESESGPPGGGGTGACETIPDASSDGENSGLQGLESVALSRDGRSLYAASGDDAAVSRFRRDRDTGKLTYRGCLSGDDESACEEIPAATPGGFGEQSGLDNLQSLVLSRDGKSLYAASAGDSAVARFKRDQDTGKLTYKGCITGETESGPSGGGGTGACKAIPGASSDGENSGLEGLRSVALSRDGRSLYAASGGDAAVSRFKRDRGTGKLTYKGCLSGDKASACKEIPDATPGGFGDNSGLQSLASVALSGKSLYAASGGDSAVARFRRDGDTGELTYRGCISGDDESACKEIPVATPGGFGEQSGLDNPQSLALSGDGKSLYVASLGDSAVGRFRRER